MGPYNRLGSLYRALFSRRDGALSSILLGRMALLFVLFGTILLHQLIHTGWKLYSPNLFPVWFLVILSFGIGAVASLISKKITKGKGFVASLIVVDALTITVLIYMTGTNESYFPFLYLVLISFSTLIFGRRGAVLTALLSSVCYSALMLVDPIAHDDGLIFNLLVNNGSFFIVGLLVGYVVEELKLTGLRLGESVKEKRALEELNRTVVTNISVGLMTTTLGGKIVYLNPAGEKILDLSLRKASQYLLEDILPDFDAVVRAFKNEERENNIPLAVIRYRPDRVLEEKYLECAISALKNSAGEKEGYVIIFNDKTEMRKMEEQLQLSDKQAAIGQTVAIIAHEIRNPLASISGSMELLRQNSHLQTEEKRLVDISLSEVDHLNSLISELLDYSRPEKKELQVFHINELISETLKELELHREYRSSVRINVGMPDLVIPVVGDRGKIKQVFWNLFLNACQAMGEDGTLSISLGETATEIEVVVEDSGEGIPAENLNKIFNPFFTTKDNGTGLGLAMVYKIIESHSGSIAVSSKEGIGTKFKVYLPKPHVMKRRAGFIKENIS